MTIFTGFVNHAEDFKIKEGYTMLAEAIRATDVHILPLSKGACSNLQPHPQYFVSNMEPVSEVGSYFECYVCEVACPQSM